MALTWRATSLQHQSYALEKTLCPADARFGLNIHFRVSISQVQQVPRARRRMSGGCQNRPVNIDQLAAALNVKSLFMFALPGFLHLRSDVLIVTTDATGELWLHEISENAHGA
jgi:hypothetical protein